MSDSEKVDKALREDDARALAQALTKEEIEQISAAEGLLERRKSRTRFRRFMLAGQAIAAYVALAGFFANAWQNYADKVEQHRRTEAEQDRWNKEFKRAQDADKYRAFFETSSLVTDPNQGKHVIGYTLLREFVDDEQYKAKALTLLETALSQELRSNTASVGIDQERRVAITTIVTALGHTSDCGALERAARSVDRLGFRQDRIGDAEETSEVYSMYVRHVLGGGAKSCKDPRDFDRVRVPIRLALMKTPVLGGVTTKLDSRLASRRMAELLRDECEEEMSFSSTSDCDDVFRGYQQLCVLYKTTQPAQFAEQVDACAVVDTFVAGLAPELGAPATEK